MMAWRGSLKPWTLDGGLDHCLKDVLHMAVRETSSESKRPVKCFVWVHGKDICFERQMLSGKAFWEVSCSTDVAAAAIRKLETQASCTFLWQGGKPRTLPWDGSVSTDGAKQLQTALPIIVGDMLRRSLHRVHVSFAACIL